MTVSSTTNEVSYTGPQPAALPFTFRILQDSDLTVTQVALDGTLSTLVLNTDYTVQGVLSYAGGTVTLAAGDLGTGVQAIITRTPGEVQDTSLQSQAAYDAKTVENALDLLTMIAQWLQNQADRSLKVPPGTTPITLPDPLALALLQWNAGATGLQNISIADLGTILAAGNYIVDRPTFTAGVSTTLTLTQAPGTVNNAAVFFDGVYQQKPTYSVSGTTLMLTSPVPLGVLSVEVVQAGVLPINTPADNSVATATVQALAITGPKMADSNVDGRNMTGTAPQRGRNGIIDGSAIVANGSDYATTSTGAYGYGKSSLCKGAITGGTSVAGTLTQVTNSSAGVTGCADRWSAVTLVGTGCTVKYRRYIEAKDAVRYKNSTATFSARAYHNVGSAINYTITVSKATAADNFAAVTTIQAGSAQSVASATDTAIYLRAITMGDCSNGIQIDVVASSGAVAGKLFDLTDWQLEPGSTETAIEIRPVAIEEPAVLRYYETLGGHNGDVIANLFAFISTASATGVIYFARKRTVPTITAQTYASFSLVDYNGATIACTLVDALVPMVSSAQMVFEVAAGLTGKDPYYAEATATSGLIKIDARF